MPRCLMGFAVWLGGSGKDHGMAAVRCLVDEDAVVAAAVRCLVDC
jgi:hypothetical protein